MGNRSHIESKMEGLKKHIEIHNNKIDKERYKPRPDYGLINHWQKEINTAYDQISNLKDKLYSIPADKWCYSCHKDVTPKNSRCPKCRTML